MVGRLKIGKPRDHGKEKATASSQEVDWQWPEVHIQWRNNSLRLAPARDGFMSGAGESVGSDAACSASLMCQPACRLWLSMIFAT
jgi:hypothetical protein